MRIEVGYGLAILPDGLAGAIVRDEFLPHFRKDDYQTGLVRGVRRVANVVRRNQVMSAEELEQLVGSDKPLAPWWIIIPFAGVFVGVGSCVRYGAQRTGSISPSDRHHFRRSGYVGLDALQWSLVTVHTGFIAVLMGVVGYRKPVFQATGGSRSAQSKSWSWGATSSGSSSGRSWSSSDSRSSSSSSGSSFGGGSSGGGVASGRW